MCAHNRGGAMRNAEKYPAFDMRILEGKKRKVISSQEALKDIAPAVWGKEVLDGKKKIKLYEVD